MEILAQYSVSPSSISPPPQVPQQGPYTETPVPELSSTHKPLAYEPSPRFPSEVPMETGAHLSAFF
jgi:hypothetical protein